MIQISPHLFRRTKLVTVLVFSFVFAAIAVVSVRLYDRHNEAEKYDEEAKIILKKKSALLEIKAVVIDLETGARAYAITGNDQYLEPSNRSVGNIFSLINSLKASANEYIDDKIIKLEQLVDNKINNSTATIELRRNKGTEAAIANIKTGEGLFLMNEVRMLIEQLLTEQNKIAATNQAAVKKLSGEITILFIVLFSLLILSIVSGFFVIKHNFQLLNGAAGDLLLSNNFLNSILENIPDMVFVKEATGLRFVRFNKAGEKLLGYSRHALIGKNDYDFFPKEQADFFVSKDREVLANKEVLDIHEELIDTAHGKRWLHTKKIVINDDHGKPNYLLGISADITDKKTRELSENQQLLEIKELFNNAPCGYLNVNKEGIITAINDTYLNWLGYSRLEVVNRMHCREIVAEESIKVFNYYHLRFRSGETKSIHDLEIQVKRKDGSQFPGSINAVAVYDLEGNFIRSKSTMFDISIQQASKRQIIKN